MRVPLTRLVEVVARVGRRPCVVQPAHPDAIEALTKKYPDVPTDVLDFYRMVDGAPLSDPWWEFVSIARILANASMLDEMIGADFGDSVDWWSNKWIPVGVDCSGNALCVDTGGTLGGSLGQVLIFMHDEERRQIIAPSLDSYITCLCVATETGVLDYNGDDGFCLDGNQDRWEKFLSDRLPGYPIDGRLSRLA